MIRFFRDGLIWYQHEPVTRPHGNIIVYTGVVICRITDLGGRGGARIWHCTARFRRVFIKNEVT